MDSQDAALEAAIARKADAEVSFKFNVFIEEFMYNFFGLFSLPVVLWRKGRVGAANRMLTSFQSILTSLIWTGSLYGFVVLHIIFNGKPGYVPTNYEVILVMVLWFCRCLTIAVKWAYFTEPMLAEMDNVRLPLIRILETFVLFGWTTPTLHVLFVELERALIRVAPNLCSHRIMYADKVSRDSMVWSMRKSLPSYLEYELGIDVAMEARMEEQERNAKSKERTARRTISHYASKAVSAAAWGLGASLAGGAPTAGDVSKATVSVTPDNWGPEGGPTGAATATGSEEQQEPVDNSVEAVACRRYIALLDSGAGPATYCEFDLEETMKSASRAAVIMAAAAGASDPSSGATTPSVDGDVTEDDEDAAGADVRERERSAKREKDKAKDADAKAKQAAEDLKWKEMAAMMREEDSTQTEALPFIPSKLVAWHAIHLTHIEANPSKGLAYSYYFIQFCAWTFAFLPTIARAACGNTHPFGTIWPSYVTCAMLILTASINFSVTSRFLTVAPIDFARRLNMMALLSSLIDPMSPVATEFALPQLKKQPTATGADDRGKNPSADSDGEDADASEEGGDKFDAEGAGCGEDEDGDEADPVARALETVVNRRAARASSSASSAALSRGGRSSIVRGDSSVTGGLGGGGSSGGPVVVNLMARLQAAPMSRTAAARMAEVQHCVGGVCKKKVAASGAAAAAIAQLSGAPLLARGRPSNTVPAAGLAGSRFSNFLLGGAGGPRASTATSLSLESPSAPRPSTGGPVGPRFDGGALITTTGPVIPDNASRGGAVVITSNPVTSVPPPAPAPLSRVAPPPARAGVSSLSAPPRPITIYNAPIAIVAAPRPQSVAPPAPPRRESSLLLQQTAQGVTNAVGSALRSVAAVPFALLTGSTQADAPEGGRYTAAEAERHRRDSMSMHGAAAAAGAGAAASAGAGAAATSLDDAPRSSLESVVAPNNTNAISAAACRPGGRIEGFLEKRALRNNRYGGGRLSIFGGAGGSGNENSGWKRRYFVCESSSDTLLYSKGPTFPALNTIPLTHRSVVAKADVGPRRPHAFMLILDSDCCSLELALSGKVYDNKGILYVAANDERTCQAWMAFLAGIITRKLKEKQAVDLATAQSNAGFATPSISAPATTAAPPPRESVTVAAGGAAGVAVASAAAAAAASRSSTPLASIGRNGDLSELAEAAVGIGSSPDDADDDAAGEAEGASTPTMSSASSAIAAAVDADKDSQQQQHVLVDMGVVTTASKGAGSSALPAVAGDDKEETTASVTAKEEPAADASSPAETSVDPAGAEGKDAETSAGLRQRKSRARAEKNAKLVAERLRMIQDKGASADGDGSGNRRVATVRNSILARHRLLMLENDSKAVAGSEVNAFHSHGGLIFAPILFAENLTSFYSLRTLLLDFGDGFKQRVSVYNAIFGATVLVSILLLLFQFTTTTTTTLEDGTTTTAMTQSQLEAFAVTIATSAFGQLVFSIFLAISIVMGSRLNEATTLHRFKLSRCELLISDLLVASEMPAMATKVAAKRLISAPGTAADTLGKMLLDDNPVVRQLRLTRQVAASISSALVIETTVMPARVLFMPANTALLSTFFSLSISGVLSAAKALKPPQ